MDNTKDNQNSLEIAKFVESQTLRTNPFGDNKVGERAYKRCERIAAALVLLTNHVAEEDVLRREIRSKSMQLLSCVLSLREEMRALNSERVMAFKSIVRELISLTRLLAVSGYVSFQNASAVSEALDELSQFLLASQRSSMSESVSFSREDFLDVRERGHSMSYRNSVVSDRKVHTKDPQKDGNTEALAATKPEGGSASPERSDSLVRSARAQAIIDVLRESGALGIRDIASNLPEYSEKMIQRELADLVLAGTIAKTGSKRWSTYGLREN